MFISWFENPPDTFHSTAADAITDIWILDPNLAEAIAQMPWVADGVTGGESAALEAVVSNASSDTEWARLTVSLPWFLDGVTRNERNAIIFLREIAQSNLELAKVATDLPWLADGVTNDELNTIKFLSRATSEHLELVQTITKRHWFTNSIDTHNESWAIQRLVRIAENDPELARTIAILPGLNDGITDDHLSAIYSLESIAENDLELAKMITNLPWLTDDITRDEEIALQYFDIIVGTDVDLARMVAGFPWFTDDITEEETSIIHAIRRTDADWASQLAASVNDLLTSMKDITGGLSTYTAESLGRIAEQGPDAFGQLTSQPWYADGLNDEEAALVVILGNIIDSSPLLYQDLLHSRFIQTKTISLSLAGDVNIYIVQSAPFPPDEDLLTTIENTARIAESFLGEPFPTTDIILLVTDPEDGFAGRHYGTYMTLVRSLGNVESIPHETAHYYAYEAPRWFVEGFAEFMETYVEDQTGIRSIADRRLELLQNDSCFTDLEMENIRHYLFYLTEGGPPGCSYPFGENFMLAIFESIGEEAMSTALRELYLANEEYFRNPERGQIPDEEAIYDTFLKHTPSDRREALIDVYRRLHGGAFAFDDVPFVDDYGDEPSDASEIATGGAIEGTLDYMFDFDYFKFQAEEDQKYRIAVNHESLGSSSITLYDPDGLTRGRLKSLTREASGSQIQWVAPSSDEYYFAVQNFGGKTGAYTLTITPVASIEDDHGDTIATATNISLGEVVQGAVDGDFDYDYFQFQAVEGKTYRVAIELGIIEYYHLHLYTADRVPHDSEYGYWEDGVRGGVPHDIIDWTPSSSGTFYLAIDGAQGNVGTYTVTITAIDDDSDG